MVPNQLTSIVRVARWASKCWPGISSPTACRTTRALQVHHHFRTAMALRLTVPSTILARADD